LSYIYFFYYEAIQCSRFYVTGSVFIFILYSGSTPYAESTEDVKDEPFPVDKEPTEQAIPDETRGNKVAKRHVTNESIQKGDLGSTLSLPRSPNQTLRSQAVRSPAPSLKTRTQTTNVDTTSVKSAKKTSKENTQSTKNGKIVKGGNQSNITGKHSPSSLRHEPFRTRGQMEKHGEEPYI